MIVALLAAVIVATAVYVVAAALRSAGVRTSVWPGTIAGFVLTFIITYW